MPFGAVRWIRPSNDLLLRGHSKLESPARHLVIEIEDALVPVEQTTRETTSAWTWLQGCFFNVSTHDARANARGVCALTTRHATIGGQY